jgi:tetratricopeptide (TPR) repeat protein
VGLANAAVIALWGAFAATVIVRGSRWLRERAPEARFDGREQRIAGMAAFYLATPACVLAAMLAQVTLLRLLGATVARFEPWVYLGFVEPSAETPLAPMERAMVAATGNGLLLVAAAACFIWTRLRPASAPWNHFRIETGRFLLLVGFGLEPFVSILTERGNTASLRAALRELHPQAGDGTLLVIGLVAALTFAWWRRAHRLRLLGTALYDAMQRAEQRLATHPDDPDALRALGAARLAIRDPAAVVTLERALAGAPDDARVELLLARAYLDAGRAHAAAEHLRNAGQRLEADGDRDGLMLEVMLSLSTARVALGDAEGAILTAEAAREQAPRDPRTLLGLADALVAGGRFDDAKRSLDRALEGATGAVRRQIERRLAALKAAKPPR